MSTLPSQPPGDPNSSTSLRIVAESKKYLFKAATTHEWFQKTSMTGMFETASGKWYRSPRSRKAPGSMVRQNSSDTMAARPLKFSANPRPDQALVQPWIQWKNWLRSYRPASDSIGLGFPMKNGREVPKLEYCMRSR